MVVYGVSASSLLGTSGAMLAMVYHVKLTWEEVILYQSGCLPVVCLFFPCSQLY